ncbi:HNH endonuclease [Paenarthrobacter nicotinovorans]|uniref:HNH endonuclease n=1 Tax=Paenarthrobacter nicotinovorans TaxID=29320 RepID=UPI0037489AF5
MSVYDLKNVAFRLALLRQWKQRCVRCQEPITYVELHIDHFIPKSLDKTELSQAIKSFELRKDYDLDETYNLVPSCGPCNLAKGNKLPRVSHLTLETIESAGEYAPEIEKQAEKLKKTLSAPVSKALATIDANRDNPEVIQEMLEFLLSIKESQVIEPKLTLEFLLAEFVRLGIDSHGSTKVSSVGDCPNPNCRYGDVDWQTWGDSDSGELEAGVCPDCDTRAVTCPECGTKTAFFWNEVECGYCDKRFRAVEHGGELVDFVTF